MKVLDALLIFACNEQDLDNEKDIKNWSVTNVKVDDNDYINIYDIETVDRKKIEITIHAQKA